MKRGVTGARAGGYDPAMHKLAALAASGLAIVSLDGCAPGSAVEAVRPDDPTYAEATGAPACRVVESRGEPLVVDWRPEQRTDVEVAMRQGIAVVAYDCSSLRILSDCSIQGNYGFVGVTTKEQLIRLENADEIQANLPLTGGSLAARLGGEVTRGTTLDVALVIIGKRMSTRIEAKRENLVGRCDGATHFVRGATIGAFAMQTGTRAATRTAAELFGAGPGGTSSSSKDMRHRDGSLSECRGATPDAGAPPAQCGALLRLDLTAIDAAAPDGPALAESTCPRGLVRSGGKCAVPTASTPYQCLERDVANCLTQCDRGDAASCRMLASVYSVGMPGLPADPPRAVPLYQKACDAGDADACKSLGVVYDLGRGAPQDERRAIELYAKACDAGEMLGCSNLGFMYERGAGASRDLARAIALYQRACDGGAGIGCNNLGKAYAAGRGVPREEIRAFSLYRRACDGGTTLGCMNLAGAYREGIGVPRDDRAAAALYETLCQKRRKTSCSFLGELYELGEGVPKDEARALSLYKVDCDRKDDVGCTYLGMRYEMGKGVPKDEAKAAALYKEACQGESTAGCLRLGYLIEHGRGLPKDPARAVELYKSGCDAGNDSACASLGVAYELGRGVPRDPAKAAELFRQTCKGQSPCAGLEQRQKGCEIYGRPRQCTSLGMMYALGAGLDKDAARAAALMRKACSGGDSAACDALKVLPTKR